MSFGINEIPLYSRRYAWTQRICSGPALLAISSPLFGLINYKNMLIQIQSTLVISNSLILNNLLSKSNNLVPILTQRSTNKKQNIVENRRVCSQYFQYISNLGVKFKIHSVTSSCWINCFPQFHKSDMLKYGYLEVFHRVPWISR